MNIVPGRMRISFQKLLKNRLINIGTELALLHYQRNLKPILAHVEATKSLMPSQIISKGASCEISR